MKGLRWLLAAALAVSTAAQAYTIEGKVVGISDGDTLTVLDAGKKQHKIRLADIDAPESSQPYGNRARQRLSELAFGKQVVADCREQDRYKRDVCTLTVDGTDVNVDLVATGHAWVYSQYNRRDDLPAIQDEARAAAKGLWGQPEAQIVEPSQWRKSQKEVQLQVQQAKPKKGGKAKAAVGADFGSCGSKRYCGDMRSCAEAQYYYRQCGVSRLDGDKDGIPCEKLCGN